MTIKADDIFLEITADDAPLCDEYGDHLFDEGGSDIYLEQVGFVDVWEDVLKSRDVEFSYGITGNSVTDRVAGIGSMGFRLNNSAANSAGLAGYYSPDHSNFRGGFEKETPVKLTFEYSGVRYVKWRGLVKDIKVEPGQYAGRFVDVDCNDWMTLLDEFTEMNLQSIQTNTTSTALYTLIEGYLQRRFPTTSFATNLNSLTYGFDTATKQKSTARNEINKIALSVFDYVFPKGDTYEGAKLTSQTFAQRVADVTSDFTLSGTMKSMDLVRSDKIDRAKTTIYPRSVGTAAEVIYTLNVQAGKAQSIYPGATLTFVADYSDPNQTSARVASNSVSTPVASTDYKLGRGNGDSSEDLNASGTVTVTAGATSATITITNNHATYNMYVNAFRLQGTVIRQFEGVESILEVSDALGDKEIAIDLVYEDDIVGAQAITDLVRTIYQTGFTQIAGVTYNANRNATLFGYAMTVEPGMRGTIVETQSGINQNAFVNGVTGRIYDKEFIDMTYVMEMAQPTDGNFWLLGEVGYSELGDTTFVFGV